MQIRQEGTRRVKLLPRAPRHNNKLTIKTLFHDDVIKWKHFPRYWPFVLGIHRSPLTKASKAELWCFLLSAPETNETPGWFETPSRSLWRHCNVPFDPAGNEVRIIILYNWVRITAAGPLFTKRKDVLPQDLGKSRSREIHVWTLQSLWNLTGTSAATLSRCLSNFRAIRKFNTQSSGLETPRDFTVSEGWIDPCHRWGRVSYSGCDIPRLRFHKTMPFDPLWFFNSYEILWPKYTPNSSLWILIMISFKHSSRVSH